MCGIAVVIFSIVVDGLTSNHVKGSNRVDRLCSHALLPMPALSGRTGGKLRTGRIIRGSNRPRQAVGGLEFRKIRAAAENLY